MAMKAIIAYSTDEEARKLATEALAELDAHEPPTQAKRLRPLTNAEKCARHRARLNGQQPPPRREAAPTFVYFARAAGGPIKIGLSRSPQLRIDHLATGSPEDLRLLAVVPGNRERERQLHERFAAHRVRGEWFAPEPELLDFIGALA
jgi:hypothetical protein